MSNFSTATGSIYYEVLPAQDGKRDAPTLTLLHNFMSSGRTAWGQLLPKLNRDFRILLPDLPGHGRSIGHPTGYRYDEMAEQLAALMQAEAATTGHLAGCSAGGMIAQLLVYHQLVQPTSLILISTAYSTNPAELGIENELTPEQFVAPAGWMEATARLHDPYQGEGYYFRELLPGFRALRTSNQLDLSLAALKSFQMPVCLIHGEQDEFFPISVVQKMHSAFPHSELSIEAGQPHALIFRRPWVVAERMSNFLTEVMSDEL